MTRYDWIELAQLVFALTVMMAAFAGGLAVGWWRWGRSPASPPETPGPPPGQGALFSPDDRDEIDLSDLHRSSQRPGGDLRSGLFTSAPGGAPGNATGPRVYEELDRVPAAAIEEAAIGGDRDDALR